MRMLYLSADPGVPVLGHKGASVHVRELCAAFAQEGVEVDIASPRVAPEGDVLTGPAELHRIAGVLPKMHTAVTLRDAVRAQAREVVDLVRRFKPDAIYERFSLFSVAGVQAARALGAPHVLEVNAPLRDEAARYRTLPHADLAARFESEVMAMTQRVLAVSEPLADALARGGVDERKIEVSPNGVAAERFPRPHRDESRFVVGFAGSLKPWHGLDTLVDAMADVTDAQLEVVGHGPLDHLFDALPAGRVTRFGARPHSDVVGLMAGWDVGVAPYAPIDGFWFSPLKVLEYMAAGACPVVSDLSDAPKVLGYGRRGVLVPAGDAAALAAEIRTLAHNRERAMRLGERARRWVSTKRSWSANAQRALAAIERGPVREAA
jgi:glycosyltransferase involved in cell wall biosynthesis